MSYFRDHADHLSLRIQTDPAEPGLRECQAGAYWATLAHFTASDDPALLALPTGAGKTGLMMLLAFGLRAQRVLVVTPAVELRRQTFDRFSTLADLAQAGAVPAGLTRPKAHQQIGRITSQVGWEKLRPFDVVVATPHTISQGMDESIAAAPVDLFDLVLVDEAHHARALSWTRLLERFHRSRIVLLTATPFRLDGRRLPGRLVYYYPVGKALDAGIYREIVYHPVTAAKNATDDALCEKACELLEHERKTAPDIRLLVRTASVAQAPSLVALYGSRGLRVREVHYRKSGSANDQTVRDLRAGRLDGVVCVGMLGEGLDIPELKIAALHSPPKSFPFTLQLIGRVSRMTRGQAGPAHVVANPEQVGAKSTGRELRRLYHEDASWRRLIPHLVREVVGPLADPRVPGPRVWAQTELRPADIRPFFSARLARAKPKEVRLHEPVDLSEEVQVYEIPLADTSFAFRGLVTEREIAPPWATRLELRTTAWDLHLFFYHEGSQTLFVSTTSEALLGDIEKQIVGETEPLDGVVLSRLIGGEYRSYPMLGLANTLARTPALPTYKMFMGPDVQAATGAADRAAFVLGHGLAREEPDEPGGKPWTRGVGIATGKVWSMQREPLIEWIDWCDTIGWELLDAQNEERQPEFLPGVSTLRRVRRFEAEPVAVLFSPFWVDFNIELVQSGQAATVEITDPKMQVVSFDRDKRRVIVSLQPADGCPAVRMRYDLELDRWGAVDSNVYVEAKLYRDDLIEDTISLERLLLRLPPHFYLENGTMIRGGQLHATKPEYEDLPASCFLPGLDWSDCDTTLEYADPAAGRMAAPGKKSVHDWLEEQLVVRTSSRALILKDHASGEIADFVVLDPERETVSFYHCKAGNGGKSRAGMDQVRPVLDQVLRTVLWVKSPKLFSEIRGRGDGTITRPASRFVKGVSSISDLEKVFQPARWRFVVAIVQPGLDGVAAAAARNTNLLLVSCHEWLRSVGAELLIWCDFPAVLGKRRGPLRAAGTRKPATRRAAS